MSNTPSDEEILVLAQQHLKAFAQFRLGEVWFEGEVEFARAVLEKWGTQPQAGVVPQGWKAVPVNPTPEMWKAAKSVPDPNPPYPPHYGLVWDAMLAASPTPPAEQAAPKAAPTRTALPDGWTDCTVEFDNDGPEVVAYGPKRMMNRLAKWLGKYFAQVIADAAPPKAAPVTSSTQP